MSFLETLSSLKRFFTSSLPKASFALWSLLVFAILAAWALEVFPAHSAGERIGNQAVGFSALAVLFSALIFWSAKDRLLPLVRAWKAPVLVKFVSITGIGAFWVELVYWSFQQFFGANGLAASQNLALDLLITMPWYLGMAALFWKALSRYKYSFWQVLLLGGLYDFFADGLAKGPNPAFVFMFPLFTANYSILLLPASFLLEEEIAQQNPGRKENGWRKWAFAVLPLLALPLSFIVPISLAVAGAAQ